MESMTEIALLPGFGAVPGSRFGAEVIDKFPIGTGGGARLERTQEEIKIENAMDSLLTVAPNPSKGEFKIKSLGKYTILGFFNLSGQMVDYQQEADKILLIDPRPGMYILVVITENGRRYSKKLIVE